MIDFDDVNDAALFVSGIGLFGAVFVVVLFFIALSNSAECSKKHCPNEMKPRLMDSACICTTEAE